MGRQLAGVTIAADFRVGIAICSASRRVHGCDGAHPPAAVRQVLALGSRRLTSPGVAQVRHGGNGQRFGRTSTISRQTLFVLKCSMAKWAAECAVKDASTERFNMISSMVRDRGRCLLPSIVFPGQFACGPVVDHPVSMPAASDQLRHVAPPANAKAVIVYGKDAPTKSAAEVVQKSRRRLAGRLKLADDRAVTGEDTWLPADACRKTPLIVRARRTTAS
jgi:hypothetical protein